MMLSQERWYVVQCKPRAESEAALHLRRQGFITYLPRYLKIRRHARRVEKVSAPLYPGYLFTAFDQGVQRWRAIASTVGVVRILCHGDTPAPILEEFIQELRSREDSAGIVQLDNRPNFRAGDKVRVLDGAFAESFGLYEGAKDRDRVAILLDLLGRKVRVLVGLESVVRA